MSLPNPELKQGLVEKQVLGKKEGKDLIVKCVKLKLHLVLDVAMNILGKTNVNGLREKVVEINNKSKIININKLFIYINFI